MKKRNIIFIIYALVLFTIVCSKLYFDYQNSQKLKQIIVKEESRALSAFIIAFRQAYQTAFVENHIAIDEKTLNLLPVRTSGDIADKFSDILDNKIIIRNVSDRPRNPENQANTEELEIISYFNNNLEAKSFFKDVDTAYYYATPLYIEQNCLKCHGEQEYAIETVRNNYDSAYDYKLGELRGIISINMTKQNIKNNIENTYKRTFLIILFMFILLMSIGYLGYPRKVGQLHGTLKVPCNFATTSISTLRG